jgi:glycosyltransferase involved in cell wall biosynthesis
MDWCVTRAIKSCQIQSLSVDEIIVVDDCSIDKTETVVQSLMNTDPRIKYWKLGENSGHLAAITFGANKATSNWVALLDADDELTSNSIEARLVAVTEYNKVTGVKPQLVYGDHPQGKFPRLEGHIFSYLCKELCLCQTSTMMLGQECISYIPREGSTYCTDDEIVLAIGKYFPVLHSGATVAIYHEHDNPTRMGNNAKKRFEGVRELVRGHRADIAQEWGIKYLFLWRLRILRSFVRYQAKVMSAQIASPQFRNWRFLLRLYRLGLLCSEIPLRFFLQMHFDRDNL